MATRLLAGLPALLFLATPAAATPAASFAEATRLDLDGQPQLAYAAYLDAAEAGLPDAEFNVAVMLDSGRGVAPDPVNAALWYARAASHGNARAAYNLGQLYESGQGVPRNAAVAKAWFEASKLPAARDHLIVRPDTAGGGTEPTAPDLVAPLAGDTMDRAKGGVELVWTSAEQPRPTRYVVEMRSVEPSRSDIVFATETRLSSVFVDLPNDGKTYAWRVATYAGSGDRYAVSNWSAFRLR